MHCLALLALEVDPVEETESNNCIQHNINLLREKWKERKNILLELQIKEMNNLKSTFARNVREQVYDCMVPYDMETEDPNYLKFCNRTDDLYTEWKEEKVNCIRLPQGDFAMADWISISEHFVIHDGKVYERNVGELRHDRRTKKAKRMKVVPQYPLKKMYSKFDDYVEAFYGYKYDSEYEGYGFYYNPQGHWDSYRIGGRWSQMFLVKNTCQEYFTGECVCTNSKESPEGYKWVCAARKKDIEWDLLRTYKNQKALEQYEALRNYYQTGEKKDDIYGIIKEDGVYSGKRCLYFRGETAEDYLKKCGISENRKYPIDVSSLVNPQGWEDIEFSKNNQKDVDEFLNSSSGEMVICAVDYHE